MSENVQTGTQAAEFQGRASEYTQYSFPSWPNSPVGQPWLLLCHCAPYSQTQPVRTELELRASTFWMKSPRTLFGPQEWPGSPRSQPQKLRTVFSFLFFQRDVSPVQHHSLLPACLDFLIMGSASSLGSPNPQL